MIVPCKDCTKREMGCHSKCTDYLQYKKELDEYNKQIRNIKQAYHDTRGYQIMSNCRMNKKKPKQI